MVLVPVLPLLQQTPALREHFSIFARLEQLVLLIKLLGVLFERLGYLLFLGWLDEARRPRTPEKLEESLTWRAEQELALAGAPHT